MILVDKQHIRAKVSNRPNFPQTRRNGTCHLVCLGCLRLALSFFPFERKVKLLLLCYPKNIKSLWIYIAC